MAFDKKQVDTANRFRRILRKRYLIICAWVKRMFQHPAKPWCSPLPELHRRPAAREGGALQHPLKFEREYALGVQSLQIPKKETLNVQVSFTS
jgi:hypothetical protein